MAWIDQNQSFFCLQNIFNSATICNYGLHLLKPTGLQNNLFSYSLNTGILNIGMD